MFVKSLEPRASGEAAAAFESSSQCALEGHGFLSEEAQSLLQQNKVSCRADLGNPPHVRIATLNPWLPLARGAIPQLVLVLDLDQTLIDSTVDGQAFRFPTLSPIRYCRLTRRVCVLGHQNQCATGFEDRLKAALKSCGT